jgi:RNA polymerase sigma factor (sigma-70 family)
MSELKAEPDPSARPPASSATSVSLLQRVKAQDGDAWRRLTELYGPTVYGWCRRAGLSPDDAADVGQEVFRAVVTAVDGFRRDQPGDSFRGWLCTITQNKIRDHWRRGAAVRTRPGGRRPRNSSSRCPRRRPWRTARSRAAACTGGRWT